MGYGRNDRTLESSTSRHVPILIPIIPLLPVLSRNITISTLLSCSTTILMDDEVARLRALLEAAEKRSAEEQRRRENAEKLAIEEQRRRREEEEHNRNSRPQALPQYLEACHSLSLAIQVVTEKSLTTQGDTTNPTGRIYPRRIVPWDDYPTRQENIWDRLSVYRSFCSDPAFPSSHQLDYVASLIHPIASEMGLRHFERDTVENAVQKLVDAAYNDEQLRAHLGLLGSVTFESHMNLGNTIDAVSHSIEQMTMTEDVKVGANATTPAPKRARRRAGRGRKGPADQFCIYRRSDSRNVPALAIEYKAPHKLTRDEVVAGLREEIQPERDVINQDGQGFAFASRRLTAAVITQLFSYMVDKDIQYGYVCTGETFIFLHIPDDPSIIYYSVCVPNLDVMEDDENRLHRTAVAQVFAFVLQALRSPPPPLAWHDRAEGLDTWAVEFEDVLRDIPETERKALRASPYKAQRWKGFTRSPIKTRSRCRLEDGNTTLRNKDESEDEGPPPSPSESRLLRSSKKASASTGAAAKGAKRDRRGGGGTSDTTEGQIRKKTQTRIQDRAFCTQECLSGLASGGPMDGGCPNFSDHQRQHISLSEYRRLMRAQLARDRGSDADSMPLYLSGSVGALFKVRLSSHGYTLVAKGVEHAHLGRLQHEKKVYDRLRTIQGRYIPVCLGNVDLVLPYYYNGGVYEHFLFLGWAGRPLFDLPSEADKAAIVDTVSAGFKAIHNLHVLHGDAEPRNILYDADNGHVMIVDFERAKFSNQEPLGLISPNRKRKHSMCQEKQGKKNKFTTELRSIVQNVKRSIEQ
ncbi:putative serine threonine protein kinase [Rosellinia necatrix]|uniref:Putative serine threonine protein kinase n=1 Tax=Rosellinia necatrix TaxID=77044 RepID=A0A1S7UJS2_ROSNE|nr:putative serine threonine protein kinase [Rosellinia necatrix]